MDAVTFAKEYMRMCGKFSNCEKCPILKTYFCTINAKEEKAQIDTEEVVRIVEEWSAAHPRKTRQSVFMEQWPDVYLDGNRVISVSPCTVSKEYRDMNCDLRDCAECRKEFWMKEVE